MHSVRVSPERIRTLKIVSIILMGGAAGVLSGLLGIGGGAILVPMMVYLLGLDQHKAHGTSLAAISIIVLVSALLYNAHDQVDWIVAIELAAGGVIGAGIGARLCAMLSARRLRAYFGILLLVTGVKMLFDASVLLRHAEAAQAAALVSGVSFFGAVLMVFIGVLTGIASGLFGVGGGIVMVPALVILLGFPQTMAQGISLAVIIPVSISGAIIHYRMGNVRPGIGLWLGVGGILGGLAGARFALGQEEWVLKVLFGILMLTMGSLMYRNKRARQVCE